MQTGWTRTDTKLFTYPEAEEKELEAAHAMAVWWSPGTGTGTGVEAVCMQQEEGTGDLC